MKAKTSKKLENWKTKQLYGKGKRFEMLSKMPLFTLIRDMTVAQTSSEALTEGAKRPR